MAGLSPADIPLPEFLNPLLAALQEHLPPPIYSAVVSALSNVLAITAALSTLVLSLWSTSPSNWDAQAILPPLIAFLSAYLALVALYRTTSWFLRSTIWFLKWGTLLSIVIAGCGWIIGTTSRNNDVGRSSVLEAINGVIIDLVNDQSGVNKAKRPRAWHAFAEHSRWREQTKRTIPEKSSLQSLLDTLIGHRTTTFRWINVMNELLTGAEGGEQMDAEIRASTTSR